MRQTLAFAVVAVVMVGCAHANVMGIDFGSEYIKVASPHGNSSIDIVLNEQTRRKSFNFIGFRGDDRFFGEDAKNLAARFPDNMFAMVQKLIGVEYGSQQHQNFNALLHSFNLSQNEIRDTVRLNCANNPECSYSAEELVAMQLQYCKSITAKDAKIKPVDAVVTIPADTPMYQRQALIDAASIADLKILSLMHSTTATALQYGMQKRGFGNDTVNVVIFDMGATKTEVGVYRFSPPLPPKNGEKLKLAVSMGHLETLHIEVDSSLGGRSFDACIAQLLEDEIVEKLHIPRIIGGKTVQQHKAQFSLLRAANNVKETLSANTVTPVTIEGVAPDKDFSTKFSREQFEQGCSSLFTRAIEVAERALKGAQIRPEEINAFELMGGGLRPPKVVNDLSKFLGRNVDRTLNGDESAAFGAAFYGARLSAYFRIRSFSLSDHFPQSIYFRLIDPATGKRTSRRPLFEKADFGSRRSITVNRTEDFSIELETTTDGVTFSPLSEVAVGGVRAALEGLNYFEPRLDHENNTHIVRVELRLTEAGLVAVEESEVRYRFAANVSKKVKPQNKEATDLSLSDEAVPTFEIQMKKRSTSVKATLSLTRPKQMQSDEMLASKSVLAALDKLDRVKRETATAKNNLEMYIQWVRGDGILENSEATTLMSEEERNSIETAAMEVKDWYEDGEGSYDSCTKAQYDDQLEKLKNATTGVRTRLNEAQEKLKPKDDKKSKKKNKKKPTKASKEEPQKDEEERAESVESEPEPNQDENMENQEEL